MDPRLDENQAELSVAVLAEAVQVLAHRHGLLDQVVEVLRDLGSEARALEDAEHLRVGDGADLGDAVLVPEGDADLGGGVAFLGQLADLVGDLFFFFFLREGGRGGRRRARGARGVSKEKGKVEAVDSITKKAWPRQQTEGLSNGDFEREAIVAMLQTRR